MKQTICLYFVFSFFVVVFIRADQSADLPSFINLYNQTWQKSFNWDNCEDICFVPGVELCYPKTDYLEESIIAPFTHLILHEPQMLLQKNIEMVESALDQKNCFIMNDAVIKTIGKVNPLFLLDECHHHTCILSRLTEMGKQARGFFEKMISEKLVNGYVNVGSSFAFQDLVILTRTLQKNPEFALDIYLIDPKYDEYVEFLSMKKIRQVDISSNDIFVGITSQEDCKPFCCVHIKWIHECFKQLVRFIKSAYPKAKVRFFLYGYVEDFLRECEEKNISLTNMVMSSDLGKSKEARKAFSNLISFAMERSSGVQAFFLDKNKESGNAEIYVWDSKE